MSKIRILNINFNNLSEKEFLEKCNKGLVITPNVDFFIINQKDKEFYKILNESEYVLCDSQLIYIGSKFLGRPLKEKLSGSDVFPRYCQFHKDNSDIKIFLMGGLPGVAEKAAINLNKKNGREIIVGHYSPEFGYENSEQETQKMIDLFNQSSANVLALGTGAPKSEKWAFKHRDKINADIIFCIGATIDFEAGSVKRAPKWMQRFCLEWFYRLIKEPKRLAKRYLVQDPIFFWLILKEKLGRYKDPLL